MKKKIILAAVLLTVIITATISMIAANASEAKDEPLEPPVIKDNTVDLEDYWKEYAAKVPDGVITLNDVYDTAKSFCVDGLKVVFSRSMFVQQVIGHYDTSDDVYKSYDRGVGKMECDCGKREYDDKDVYLLFIASIAALDDRATWIDLKYNSSYNRMPFYVIAYSERSFESLGIKGADEPVDSECLDRLVKSGVEHYYVHYNQAKVYRSTDLALPIDERENLYILD